MKRNQALDILRGIAILLVLGYHYSYFRLWARVGWAGVDLFFVLSGFLISGLLFSEYKQLGRINLGRFLIRRGFKIYPPFYLLMSITGLSVLMGSNRARLFIPEVLFVQNYFPHIWGHTWSLAVEEHFYLLLPLGMLALLRFTKKLELLPWMLAIVMLCCLAGRVLALHYGMSPDKIALQTQFRIDSLCAGVLLGYFYHFRRAAFDHVAAWPLWIPGASLVSATLLLFSLHSKAMVTFGFTALYLGFGCVLAWAVNRAPSKRIGAVAVAWIGKNSYSIYLWHLPVGVALFPGTITLKFFIEGVIASIVVGAGMARAVETPGLLVRDKMFPRFGERTNLSEPVVVR